MPEVVSKEAMICVPIPVVDHSMSVPHPCYPPALIDLASSLLRLTPPSVFLPVKPVAFIQTTVPIPHATPPIPHPFCEVSLVEIAVGIVPAQTWEHSELCDQGSTAVRGIRVFLSQGMVRCKGEGGSHGPIAVPESCIPIPLVQSSLGILHHASALP